MGESIVRTVITNDSDVYSDEPEYEQEDQLPSSSYRKRTSYLCSFCRWCCTFQHFCYIVQLVNCVLVCALIYLAIEEYPKIEALEAQVEKDKKEIADLSEEVREKQQIQIQDLHKAVQQEQKLNFLSLAGFFTLLTCLISLFHMTTHLQQMNQPKIQRKIIAILWMSPIYSVTSFVTLIFPAVEGWMAIVKDFYESYCIYVFLSFLIAVLGEGSRDQAVDVLAKHAGHLNRPTRCLACFYEPHPDASDHAKANAVMTQCQIYCLQFTLVRPLTTIFSVFVLHRSTNDHQDEDDEFNSSIDDEFSTSNDNNSTNDNDNDNKKNDNDNVPADSNGNDNDGANNENTGGDDGDIDIDSSSGSDSDYSSSSDNNTEKNTEKNSTKYNTDESSSQFRTTDATENEEFSTVSPSALENFPTTTNAADSTSEDTSGGDRRISRRRTLRNSHSRRQGDTPITTPTITTNRRVQYNNKYEQQQQQGNESENTPSLDAFVGSEEAPKDSSSSSSSMWDSTTEGRFNNKDNDDNVNDSDTSPVAMEFPSVAPIEGGDADQQFPVFIGDDEAPFTTPVIVEGIPFPTSSNGSSSGGTFAPSFAFNTAISSAPIALEIPEGSMNNTAATYYSTPGTTNGNGDGIGNFSFSLVPTSTIAPALPSSNETTFDSGELVHQTKNYLKSPGFAVAMVVNVSIFIAFSGLLTLYHAVREDLSWCRPFPKFLTIKAVVFLTFWQGLAILLYLVLTAAPDEKEEALLEAHKYQNLLICVEMLLVAISQWCVFPAVEWKPGYEPRKMHTPGLGIKDFVSDVGQIVSNRSGRSRKGRKTTRRNNRRGSSSNTGLYRLPGTASAMSLQCDDDSDEQGKSAHGGDTLESHSCDSDIDSDNDDGNQFPVHDGYDNDGTTMNKHPSWSPDGQQTNRNRIFSEGADNADDSMELV